MMKQFRVVYEYKQGLTVGAGACFVIAADESAARECVQRDMPGAMVKSLELEPKSPIGAFEHHPALAAHVDPRWDNLLRAARLVLTTPARNFTQVDAALEALRLAVEELRDS